MKTKVINSKSPQFYEITSPHHPEFNIEGKVSKITYPEYNWFERLWRKITGNSMRTMTVELKGIKVKKQYDN